MNNNAEAAIKPTTEKRAHRNREEHHSAALDQTDVNSILTIVNSIVLAIRIWTRRGTKVEECPECDAPTRKR